MHKERQKAISYLCGLVGITRQSYYRSFWSYSKKQTTADYVLSLVSEVRISLPRLGTRKLYHLLKSSLKDVNVGRDKLFTILRANHLLIKPKRNYKITTDSKHHYRKHKNLVMDMRIDRPEQVWVSDITYIGGRGNTYLSLITDAYSKQIMGYELSDSLAAEGSVRALKMAHKNRRYREKPLIHHSDRGLQYCCKAYQRQLKKKKITPSMTETYDPYANAVAERINGILKQEFLLEEYKVDLATMKKLVDEAISLYNTKRPHHSCYMKTPAEMHKQDKIKIRTYKKICQENENS